MISAGDSQRALRIRGIKIFIGPHEIAGYYANLAKGFQEIGVDCDFISYFSHPFEYGGETRLPRVLKVARFFNDLSGGDRLPSLAKPVIAFPGAVLCAIWGISTIFRYDVFIFGFGHSLIPRWNWDLALLRWLGKTVISNLAHGSDARPPYIDGSYQGVDGVGRATVKWLIRRARMRKSRLRRIERYSDVMIGAPFSTTQFAQGNMVNWFSVGVPYAFIDDRDGRGESLTGESEESGDSCLRILHAPSHPAAKGSVQIAEAVESLKQKGYQIELRSLIGKPHSVVVDEIQKCDFVVDQLYSDTPMAGFAAEAAWFGKPAVVGGYALDRLRALVPEEMWPPSKTCHPDGIEQAMENLIVNRKERLRLGQAAQEFVRERWNAAVVARRYVRLIEGDIPENWWLDPNAVIYLEGAGQRIERSKENVRLMVETHGVEALQLSHRPDLERAFLEFAGIELAR